MGVEAYELIGAGEVIHQLGRHGGHAKQHCYPGEHGGLVSIYECHHANFGRAVMLSRIYYYRKVKPSKLVCKYRQVSRNVYEWR